MTKLDCNVTSCVHNADNCCCKQEIYVEGQGGEQGLRHLLRKLQREQGRFLQKYVQVPRRAAWRSSVRR